MRQAQEAHHHISEKKSIAFERRSTIGTKLALWALSLKKKLYFHSNDAWNNDTFTSRTKPNSPKISPD